MDVKFNGFPESDENIVYVRAVEVAELPQEVQREAEGLTRLYAVCSPVGERLALVRDRQLAFVLARQNDFAPVAAH